MRVAIHPQSRMARLDRRFWCEPTVMGCHAPTGTGSLCRHFLSTIPCPSTRLLTMCEASVRRELKPH